MKKGLVLTISAILLLITLNSCTMAGAELGLMGKWQFKEQIALLESAGSRGTFNEAVRNSYIPAGIAGDFVLLVEWEFKNDDTFIWKSTLTNAPDSIITTVKGKVIKADSINGTIKLKDEINGEEIDCTYKLSDNKLTINIEHLTFVLTKQ